MADVIIAAPGLKQGENDRLGIYLRTFGGEVLTAYTRASVTLGRHIERNITEGKSATFPVFGRAVAAYLKAGANLDDLRTNIPHGEREILIDGLLTADQLIFDLDDAMAHFDISSEYSKQIGEALAFARDGGVIAEIAKMVAEDKELLTGLGKGAILTSQVTAVGENAETGVAIYEMLLKMATAMDNNYVPAGDRVVYMKPVGVQALVAAKDILNRDYGGAVSIVEGAGVTLRVLGFDIVKCPHLTVGGATVTNGVVQGTGHVFPAAYKDSAMFVAAHRTTVGTLTLRGLAIEHARRPNFQADQIIGKYAMGHGGLRPEAAFIGVLTNKA